MKFELSRSCVSAICRAAATTTVAAAAVFVVAVAPTSAMAADLTDVAINEVESNADAVHGDWIELYNNNAVGAVDLSDAILSDNDNSHALVIPSGTTLDPHEALAFPVES